VARGLQCLTQRKKFQGRRLVLTDGVRGGAADSFELIDPDPGWMGVIGYTLFVWDGYYFLKQQKERWNGFC
jgi:hypothetical protein